MRRQPAVRPPLVALNCHIDGRSVWRLSIATACDVRTLIQGMDDALPQNAHNRTPVAPLVTQSAACGQDMRLLIAQLMTQVPFCFMVRLWVIRRCHVALLDTRDNSFLAELGSQIMARTNEHNFFLFSLMMWLWIWLSVESHYTCVQSVYCPQVHRRIALKTTLDHKYLYHHTCRVVLSRYRRFRNSFSCC